MAKQIFVNLSVKDLNKTVKFFTKLGFTFNPQFTDENAACMIIGENIFSMLVVEKFFKSFVPNKEVSDAKKNAEVLAEKIDYVMTNRNGKAMKEIINNAHRSIISHFNLKRAAEEYMRIYQKAF